MRLFEAIVEANHRALQGDPKAGIHPADFADSLPVVALSCIDPRLNPLLPEVLGLPEESFIWLRNAGNIITSEMSSTMRSLALACAVKGGREIVLIGHTDCKVSKAGIATLIDRFQALGISRSQLPSNIAEFFGVFSSETQNVVRGADIIRRSPLIGPAIPVHGLLIDIQTGRLEWLVNGYQTLLAPGAMAAFGGMTAPVGAGGSVEAIGGGLSGATELLASHLPPIPQQITTAAAKIGEWSNTAQHWLEEVEVLSSKLAGVESHKQRNPKPPTVQHPPAQPPGRPAPLPVPPPIPKPKSTTWR